jgi:hypothetical protein
LSHLNHGRLFDLYATAEAMDDLAVVADIDEALQAVEQGVLGGLQGNGKRN